MSYLAASQLVGGYGGANILHECSLFADCGKISVIVGPNGAGKSTAMKAIFGLVRLSSGSVSLAGNDITGLSPQARVRCGMAIVPQVENVFPSLTVHENLEMGAFLRQDPIAETLQEVYELFPALAEMRTKEAGDLSGGQRQQLAFGRALMTRPTALLLDEPTAGVSPIVITSLFDMILEVAERNIAVLMCEQNASQALAIADTGFVLVQGTNRYTDSGPALLANPEVRRSFLGG